MPAPAISRAAALQQTVRAAYDIARFTAEDPAAGLPDAEDLATPDEAASTCDLFHPWADRCRRRAAELARRCEDAAFATDRRITNSEGAGVSAQQSHFWAGNSRGFRGGYASSRHSISVSPIAGKGAGMQRDAWYSSMRDAARAGRARGRGPLCRRARAVAAEVRARCATCEVPVLFEAPLAAGLLGAYVQATSGGSLYRKASFLLDSLGQPVLADHMDVDEDPHIPRGKGSAPFDDEGVRTQARKVVERRRGAGLFPVQLLGAQARPADHRPRRRLAEPGADQPPHPARRRPRRDAAQAGPRPVRHRADGPGRQLRHRRLLARRRRLLGRGRAHRLSGARDHHRRQPARDVQGHRRGRRRRLHRGQQVHGLGADRAHEARRQPEPRMPAAAAFGNAG